LVLLHSLDPEKIVAFWDMPVVAKKVGRTVRKRIDMQGLDGVLGGLSAERPLVVIEDPGARPAQSGAMAFGHSLGVLHHAFHAAKLRYETIVPTKWKAALRVPASKKEAVQRADQLFPEHREIFRGARGGVLDGRAEAALIALYGVRYLR
jgi:hypothetical protein